MSDTNIISIDSSITLQPGQRVIKVGEVFLPVGIGGNFMPGAPTAGTRYYKCQAVDESTKTWSGYLAIDYGTYYAFEELPTTGLTYVAEAPEVDSIYSEDGRARVAELFNGVVAETDAAGETVYTIYMPADASADESTVTLTAATVSDGTLTLG